jgi:hypothetical protein
MTNYDYIGKKILHEHPPPHGYIVDVVEKDDEPGIVYLRLYGDDINNKADWRVADLTQWLNDILYKLNNSLSIGKYTWEMSQCPN